MLGVGVRRGRASGWEAERHGDTEGQLPRLGYGKEADWARRTGEEGGQRRGEASGAEEEKQRWGRLKEEGRPHGEMRSRAPFPRGGHLMTRETDCGWGPTSLATHLKQGHVLAIVLLSLLCVGAVDEGTALLGVAIT